MKPLVSIIIPTYNQASFLPAALTSALAQTYPYLEILVIDDGSTDKTPSTCQSFILQDTRIYYFRQENQGPSSARNRGIAASTGEYICLLDADDEMDPKCIESQLAIFASDPQVDIVYTALYLIDATGKHIGEIRGQELTPEDFLAQMFFRNIIPGPGTIMAKRACLIQNPYNEKFKHAEDYELMMRLAHQYRFKYLDLPLTSYRRHSSNLSNDLSAHRQAELEVLKSYKKEHILHVIDRSSLKEEEKILMKGKILFNLEQFQEASLIFEKLKSASAYFYRGNCELKLNQYNQAIQSYLDALHLDSTNPACHNNLGVAYAYLKNFQQAKLCFQQALKLKANYLDAQYNLDHLAQNHLFKMTFRELRQDLIPYQKS